MRPKADARIPTLLGLIAILAWSTSIGLTRSVTERLGSLTSGAIGTTCAGLLGLAFQATRPGGLRGVRSLPRKYLLLGGGLFAAYQACLVLAVGLAASRAQAIGAGVINYLWPSLLLLFGVPLLGARAKPGLVPGMALATLGIALAAFEKRSGSPAGSARGWLSLAFALGAAVSWGLYSVLTRKWAEGRGGATGLFFLASGLVLFTLRALRPETSSWSPRILWSVAWLVLVVDLLAYSFWDMAMTRGNALLVASASYATPLLSTLWGCLWLRVLPSPRLWLGCLFVIAGAVITRLSVVEHPLEESRGKSALQGL